MHLTPTCREWQCQDCGQTQIKVDSFLHDLPWFDRHCTDCRSTDLETTGTPTVAF